MTMSWVKTGDQGYAAQAGDNTYVVRKLPGGKFRLYINGDRAGRRATSLALAKADAQEYAGQQALEASQREDEARRAEVDVRFQVECMAFREAGWADQGQNFVLQTSRGTYTAWADVSDDDATDHCWNLEVDGELSPVRGAAADVRVEADRVEAGRMRAEMEAEGWTRPTFAPERPASVPALSGSALGAAVRAARAAESAGAAPGEPSHLVVVARAGTGKTTTLVEGLRYVMGAEGSRMTPSPQQAAVWEQLSLSRGRAKSVGFCAFNKSIASELQARVPAGCDAMTMHSMGFKAVCRTFTNVKVNSYRVSDIVSELLEVDIRQLRADRPTLVRATEQLTKLAKMNLTPIDLEGPEDRPYVHELLQDLADHYEVDLMEQVPGGREEDVRDVSEEVFDLVPRVLERCLDVSRDRCVDFDDMIWLPVRMGLRVFRYDLLLVDEAQDLNKCQQELAIMAGRRLVLCGDDRQAIYGFAGADASSIPNMVLRLRGTRSGCAVLPLTVTRRCPKHVVEEARKIVPDFEAMGDAPDGVVRTAIYAGPQSYLAELRDGDLALCRVTAPLVGQCFRLLREGRRANILGRDVVAGLISLIRRLGGGLDAPVAGLIEGVERWESQERAKELAKRNPSESKLIALDDKAECIHAFADGAATVGDVVRRVTDIFTDDKSRPGVLFSTIHKAKGMEARRVFFLTPQGAGCPHPMAKSAWQRGQEMNLRYVAVTRALEELVYVIG